MLPVSPAWAEDKHKPCKIQSTDTSSHMRIGWPVDKDVLQSTGNVNFLVLVTDFSDSPLNNFSASRYQRLMGLDTVTKYYKTVSNSAFNPSFTIHPKVVRMPESSSHYGNQLEVDEIVNGEWESHHMTHDAIRQVENEVKIGTFDAAIVIISGGSSLSGRVALATSQDPGMDLHASGEIHNTILAGEQAFSIEGIQSWMILVHEINHLMGVPDLYLYESDGWWQGKSAGPFGNQGYLRGHSATDSLGWNRWQRGWIPDSRVLCLSSARTIEDIKMTHSGSKDSNYDLVVIRISSTKVMVVEALKENGFNSSTLKNSILVYTVDSLIPTGFGPVRIVPKKTKITTAPLSSAIPDWVRFLEAPLQNYEQVFSNEILIRNVKYLKGANIVSIFTGKTALIENKNKVKTITCKNDKKALKIKGFSPTCFD